MAEVRIYTSLLCPFCYMAKSLLADKGSVFEEIDVTFKPSKRARMRQMAGGSNSVPQIWIGDTHVGGYDELSELERRGALDALLNARGT